MTIFYSLFIAVVGLVMYFMFENPKITTIGLIMFGVGLGAFLLVGGETISLFTR